MSRIARSVLVTAAITLTAAVPSDVAAQFRIGGGVSVSDFFGDDVGDNEARAGLALGASAGLFGIGPARLMAEVHYRQKGAENLMAASELIATGEAAEFGVDYLEIPLLIRFDLPAVGGRVVPYLNAGPVFGWQVDCGVRVNADGAEEACEDLREENLAETVRDHEQGLTLGGGFDIVVLGGLGAVSVDGRYIRGLSRLSAGGEVHNQGYAVTLGYSFGLPSTFPGVRTP